MSAGRYYWMAEEFPQAGINLRSASATRTSSSSTSPTPRSTASSARWIASPCRCCRPSARHLHARGRRSIRWSSSISTARKAYVQPRQRRLLHRRRSHHQPEGARRVRTACPDRRAGARARRGAGVSSIVTLFKKIRFDTHENLGWGPVTLPELEMQTTARRWTLPGCAGERTTSAKTGQERHGRPRPHPPPNIAPIYLMCAAQDVSTWSTTCSDPFTGPPHHRPLRFHSRRRGAFRACV